MFGFGKKKNEGGGDAGSVSGNADFLHGVTFHTMPKIDAGADLALSSGKENNEKPRVSEAMKADASHALPAPKPVAAPAPRPSLAPPPLPAKSVVAPPLLSGAPPLPHGAGKTALPVAAPHTSRAVVLIIILIILLAGGGGGWYWYRVTHGVAAQAHGKATVSGNKTSAKPPVAITETPAQETPTALQTAGEAFLADRDLPSTVDSDADLLTDSEEELYGTDPNLPDTDRDGWPDGWEIVHMYDPAQGGAARLFNGPKMVAFSNQEYGYSLIYPSAWIVQAVDGQDAKDVVVTSATGEFIQVTALPLSASDTTFMAAQGLDAWIKNQYPGSAALTLHPFTNKFDVEGFETKDMLTSFLKGNGVVYVVRYMPGLRSDINFKRTMTMMVAGFLVEKGTPPALLNNPPLESSPEIATSTPEISGAVSTTPPAP